MNSQRNTPLYDTEMNFYRGRVGLYYILKALGIKEGDHVYLQAFTCVAVPEAILACGASPVYIDIEADGYNLDIIDLEKKVSNLGRAIIVQHTFGIPADLGEIKMIADKMHIPIIEDCCHTYESTYNSRPVGTIGVAAFYSHEWGKPIVVGIGGSVRINDLDLQVKMESMMPLLQFPSTLKTIQIQLQYFMFKLLYRPRFYWPIRSFFRLLSARGIAEGNYNAVRKGVVSNDFELKMPSYLAARLKRKILLLPKISSYSKKSSNAYKDGIKGVNIVHPKLPVNAEVVFARYPLRVKNKEQLLLLAQQNNIEMADWYSTPVHPKLGDQLLEVEYEPGSCPNAESRCAEVVSLPLHQNVTSNNINSTISFINGVE